jgi:hypothetical protein
MLFRVHSHLALFWRTGTPTFFGGLARPLFYLFFCHCCFEWKSADTFSHVFSSSFVTRVARFFGKIYQMNPLCANWSWNIRSVQKIIPNGHKIFQHFHSKALVHLPKLGFFGLKINHLATLFVAYQKWNWAALRS